MSNTQDLIEQIRSELEPVKAQLRDHPYLRALEQNETAPGPEGPEAESLCYWWRRGRVEPPSN